MAACGPRVMPSGKGLHLGGLESEGPGDLEARMMRLGMGLLMNYGSNTIGRDKHTHELRGARRI